jgi:hypothetical protein
LQLVSYQTRSPIVALQPPAGLLAMFGPAGDPFPIVDGLSPLVQPAESTARPNANRRSQERMMFLLLVALKLL